MSRSRPWRESWIPFLLCWTWTAAFNPDSVFGQVLPVWPNAAEEVAVPSRAGTDDPGTEALTKPQHYLSYPRLRQADVFWEKRSWVELNVCSVANLGSDVHSAAEAGLVSRLLQAIAAGQLRAFVPGPGESLFGEAWTLPPSMPARQDQSTAAARDPGSASPTEIWKHAVLDSCRLLMVEDWLMDESSFELRPRIIALGLLGAGQGTAAAEMRLQAWIPFDEARPLLVATQALPPEQGREGLSWDDVLLMRRFKAELLKVSNVLDAPGAFLEDGQWLLQAPATQ